MRTGGAVLGDFLEEVDVGVEEERQTRRELVDGQSRRERRLDVREPVADRVGELLRGGGAGLADVVARDRHRVPAWHLRRGEPDDVTDEAHTRAGREHELLLRLILLEHVVLQRAPEPGPFDAAPFRRDDVHRQQDRRGRVDRHRGRDRPHIDIPVEILDVGDRVDGDAALPDLAQRDRIVGVLPHQRREIEGGREPVAAGGQEFLEPQVRVDRRAEAREHPHRPELRSVHVRVGPAGVRPATGPFGIRRPVDRCHIEPRIAGEVAFGHPGSLACPVARRRGGPDRTLIESSHSADVRFLPWVHGVAPSVGIMLTVLGLGGLLFACGGSDTTSAPSHGSAATTTSSSTSTSTATSGGGVAARVVRTDETMTTADGRSRTYRVVAPRDLPIDAAVPLLVRAPRRRRLRGAVRGHQRVRPARRRAWVHGRLSGRHPDRRVERPELRSGLERRDLLWSRRRASRSTTWASSPR